MAPKPAPVIDKPNEVSGSSGEYRKTIDTILILAWCSLPDGSHEFHNQRWLAFTGLAAEQAQGFGWPVAIHPDDKGRLMDARQASDTGMAGEVEARLRRSDGAYRWFLFRVKPLRDEDGKLIRWCGTATDIEDRKRAEDFLAGEKRALGMVARGNPLPSVLDALCRLIEGLCSGSLCGILLVDAAANPVEHGGAPNLPPDYNHAIHGRLINAHAGPCGMAACLKEQVIATDIGLDTRWDDDWRALALSHVLRACWSTPIIVASDGAVLGTFAIYWRQPRGPTEQHRRILEQITHLAAVAIERKRTEAALEDSEERFRLIVDSIPGLVCTMTAAGEVELVNRQVLEYFARTLEELKTWAETDAVHPDDLPRVIAAWRRSLATGQLYEIEHRIRRADGVYRWFKMRALPARDSEGHIIRWYGLLTDIDDRKMAEEKLRREEEELRRMTDAIPQHIIVLASDGTAVYANQSMLDYTGLRLEEVTAPDFRSRVVHPEDVERVPNERAEALARGLPFENEQRVRRRDPRRQPWNRSRTRQRSAQTRSKENIAHEPAHRTSFEMILDRPRNEGTGNAPPGATQRCTRDCSESFLTLRGLDAFPERACTRNSSWYVKERITMPAYVTALVAVTNLQEILTYAGQVDATVAQYGGRFIVKGGPVAGVLEGDLLPHTVTILEFPTLERAQAWYRSPEYRDIIHHRHEGGRSQVILFQDS